MGNFQNKTKKSAYILILIFIFGLSLRIWPIFVHPGFVQIDSDVHISLAKRITERGIMESVFNPIIENCPMINIKTLYCHPMFQIYPPLFHIIVALFGFIIGVGLSGKIISAVAGALIVFPVYLLARKWYNNNVGLIAAFLSVTAVDHVYYSATVVHPMALGAILFTFGLFLIYKATTERDKLSIIISIILLTLLIFTYPVLALYLGVITGLSVFIQDIKRLPLIFLIFGIAGLFSSFWVINFFKYGANAPISLSFWPPKHPFLAPFRVGIIIVIASLFALPTELSRFKERAWLFIWISIFLILSFVHVTYPIPPSRFLMHLSIPLSILGAAGIYKFINQHNELTIKILRSTLLKTGFIIACILIFIGPTMFLIRVLLIDMNSVTPNSYEAYYWLADHLEVRDQVAADADVVTHWYHQTNFLSYQETKHILTAPDLDRVLLENNVTYIYIQKPSKNLLNLNPQMTKPIIIDSDKLSKFSIVFQNEGITIYNVTLLSYPEN